MTELKKRSLNNEKNEKKRKKIDMLPKNRIRKIKIVKKSKVVKN